MLLGRFLKQVLHVGQLTVIDAFGKSHLFGPGGPPAVTIRLHDRALHWKLFVRPELYTGEAYTDGTLTVEDASLYDFLDLLGRLAANLCAASSLGSRGCSGCCSSSIRCTGHVATLLTTTTSRVHCTISSSTPTASTPARTF